MALINPSSLYSGGQGVLDSNRYMNFIIQQEAKKQAKQEALDAAFSERMAKLTPTGMRAEEIPALTRVKENLQTKFIKNKNAILNPSLDGGKAWQEWNSEFNKGTEIIAESKAAVKPEEVVFDIKKDPEKADRIDESTLTDMDRHRQPIFTIDASGQVVRNPNFKPFDVNKILFTPKPYGAKEWDDYYKRIESLYAKERKENIRFEPTKDPYLNLEISERSFAPETLRNIADDVINDFRADKSLAYSFKKGHSILNTPIEKWSRQNAEDFEKLNAIYKQIKGKDIQEPEELHAAEILRKFTTPLVDRKTITNEKQKQADREKMAWLNDSLIRGREKARAEGKDEEENIGYPTVEWANKFGFTIDRIENGVRTNTGDIYVDAEDVPRGLMEVWNPRDDNKGIVPVEPLLTFRDKTTGKTRKVYKYDPQTGAWVGKNGRIDPDYAKDQYIQKYAPSKFKTILGTKGRFQYSGNKSQAQPKKNEPTAPLLNATQRRKG